MILDHKIFDRNTDVGYWEQKFTYRGYPYLDWIPPMARLDNTFIDSVVYLYPSEQAANNHEAIGGTGFLLSVPLENNPEKSIIYVVTNIHIVANMPEIVIRINTNDGKTDLITTKQDQWEKHPYGDDVAIKQIKINGKYHKYSAIPQEALITKEFIEKFDVGGGDDVYMVGRFVNREGRNKNLPSVRKGIIASIDTESIRNNELQIDQESFLVEAHSISGYSGSPVVLVIEPFHERPNPIIFENQEDVFAWHGRLLGVDWAHIITKERLRDSLGISTLDQSYVQTNTAMMCVVPAWKIQDILDLNEQVELRKELDEKVTKMKADSQISLD